MLCGKRSCQQSIEVAKKHSMRHGLYYVCSASCIDFKADDICAHTIAVAEMDTSLIKKTALVGTNLLFLKTCINFKHLRVGKELLPFINNLFCMLKAMDA